MDAETIAITYGCGALAWLFMMGLSGDSLDWASIVTALIWPLALPHLLGAVVRRLFR